MSTFPVIKLSGDARARGLSYGRQLGSRIHRTFAFYHDVVFRNAALPKAELQKRTVDLMALTRGVFPELVKEIEAIAEAAEIEPWCVFLLNARTEVLNASVGECTSLAVPETRILAQTWDWIRELEELVVITEVEKDDGQRFVTLVEPGMLAKIGMNSRGFGVGLNFLKAEQSLDGVPVHLVLRALLECSNLAEAREVIRRSGLGKASFIPVATATGEAAGFEFAGNGMAELEPVDGVLLHTNHCLSDRLSSEMLGSSAERLATTAAHLANDAARGVEAMNRFLSDATQGENAVQCAYRARPELNGLEVGTCATIIMDLAAGAFHFRRGPDGAGGFDVLRV